MENNRLVTLSEELTRLTNLRKLYLANNPQLQLPPALQHLPCLVQSKGYAEGFKAEMVSFK